MNNKLPDLMEHILDRDPDIAFITETWLTSDKNTVTANVKDYGYNLIHRPRTGREKERGGGVGILVKSNIANKPIPCKEFHSFECNVVRIPLQNKKFMFLISVYRLQYVPVSEFMTEFADLMESFVVLNEHFVIAGDVNIHLETDECAARRLKDLIELFDLKQHMVGPTHIMGHTIDVIFTPNKCS